ncbi:MAG: hypothetical protein ACLP9L_03830 [Thermoguttaceae bacterium]
MADFNLSNEQEQQIVREYLQRNFLFKLDYDPKSTIALTGVPKKDTEGMISCTEVVEGLKKLGVPARNLGDLPPEELEAVMSGHLKGLKEVQKWIENAVPGGVAIRQLKEALVTAADMCDKNYDLGVTVIPESVVLKALPKVLSVDASELEKTLNEGASIIMVSPKDFRHFVRVTGVDFAGKSVVLPDVVLDEKVQLEKRTESETKAVLDRRVTDEASSVAIDAFTRKLCGGLHGSVTIVGEAEHERGLIEAVKRDVKTNGATVFDDPALHVPDPIKVKVRAELEKEHSLGSITPSNTPKQQQPQQQQPQKPGTIR